MSHAPNQPTLRDVVAAANIVHRYLPPTPLHHYPMLDRLLGTQMDAIVAELSLPEPVQDALLDREGTYTPLLRLARACELETPETLAEHATLLGLDASAVNRAHLSALAYADSLQHGG